jgi:uncharacterized protein (TIGR02300 family)
VTKAELGIKRTCPNCGTRYYDLNRSPIVCPRCGTEFEVATVSRGRPAAKPAVEPEAEAEVEAAPVETISLEEADDEAASTGKVEGDEDIDDDDDEDDTFLAPEEDEDDDSVEDIVGDVDEEDT